MHQGPFAAAEVADVPHQHPVCIGGLHGRCAHAPEEARAESSVRS